MKKLTIIICLLSSMAVIQETSFATNTTLILNLATTGDFHCIKPHGPCKVAKPLGCCSRSCKAMSGSETDGFCSTY